MTVVLLYYPIFQHLTYISDLKKSILNRLHGILKPRDPFYKQYSHRISDNPNESEITENSLLWAPLHLTRTCCMPLIKHLTATLDTLVILPDLFFLS